MKILVKERMFGRIAIKICGNVYIYFFIEMARKSRRKAQCSKENSGESSAHLSQEISTGKIQNLLVVQFRLASLKQLALSDVRYNSRSFAVTFFLRSSSLI